MGTKSFVFNLEWAETLSEYPAEVRHEVYDAIVRYAQSGTLSQLKPLAQMAFSFIKKEMDFNADRYEERRRTNAANGARGGRPRKADSDAEKPKKPTAFSETEKSDRFSKNPQKPNESEKSLYDNDNDNDNGYDNESENDITRTHENILGKFKNVFLKNVELRQLEENFGAEKVAEAVENLSCKIADGNVQSANHYATLTHWLGYKRYHPADAAPQAKPSRTAQNENTIEETKKMLGL